MKPSARYQAALETLDLIARIPLPMDLIIGDYMRSRRYIGSKDRAFIVTLVYDVMRHYGRLHWLGQRFGSTIYEPETGRENLYPGAKSGGGGDNKTESSTRSENQLPREQNIRQLLPACPSRLLLVLYMVSFQQWSLNDIAALFDGSRHAPTPLSPEETAVALAVFKNFSRRKRKHSSSESAPDSFPGSNEMPAAVRFECPPDLEKELRRRFGGDFDKEMSALVNPAPDRKSVV